MNSKVPKSLPSPPKMHPTILEILPKFSKNRPQILPKFPRNPLKSLSEATRSPLGEYVGLLIEKNWIFNAKELAPRRPGGSGEAKME